MGCCDRVVGVEQALSRRPLGVGVRLDATLLQAHGSVRQDREMVDVPIVDMGDHDLGFQYRDEEIRVTYHSAARVCLSLRLMVRIRCLTEF